MQPKKVILGLDLSSTRCGFAVIDQEEELLAVGYEELSGKIADRLIQCEECPQGVDIPGNFHLYNLANVYGLTDWARAQYTTMDAAKRADACIECGECEPKCPNDLPIIEQLAEVVRKLG